jgi:hypothetical protein
MPPEIPRQLCYDLRNTADTLRYLYRAVDSSGATLDFLLSAKQDAAAAKRFLAKALGRQNHPVPRVINTDGHSAYPPAIVRLKAERALDEDCRHRPVPYLNNVLEQDHRAIKRRVNASQHFRSFWGLGSAMIVARILDPGSKLATARSLDCQTLSSTVAQECHLEGSIHENELYAAMDWLVSRQAQIENALAARHLEEGCLVLYDLTSSYLEGKCCELARLGFNRDGKVGKLQIEYGLLCNREGCPVAVEVFEGNTADFMTPGSQVKKVRERFGLRRVVIVGDRGMITQARIHEELRGIEGLAWIGALRSSQIARLLQEGAIAPSLFDEKNLAEISSPDFPAERLIACRNPFLAQHRRTKREALLRATEVELQKIVLATKRQKRPLRGKAKIALRVGRLIERFKVAKHFVLEIQEEDFAWKRNEPKIAEEAALDGMYVVRTSVDQSAMSASEAVERYKDLGAVEQAFRCIKTVDLKVRPIHHRLENRVRAHVFLCMLAYYVEWHMRKALAPMLFDEELPKRAARRCR